MKKRLYPLLYLILLGLVISSCATSAQSAAPTQASDCQPPTEWEIDFSRSGGFAGQAQSITISSNGNMVAQNLRSGEKLESKLSQDELEKLAGMLAQACPFEGSRTNMGCADCFIYKLTVTMNGRQYSLEASDMNVPDASVQLFGYLGSYLTK
ncbi:MAG: hypothetical protein HY863_01305 [Chloroflexi bacterium]|nr:hypothetical protein [Chloroflexota bacterium]